jgi:hypothetical protein
MCNRTKNLYWQNKIALFGFWHTLCSIIYYPSMTRTLKLIRAASAVLFLWLRFLAMKVMKLIPANCYIFSKKSQIIYSNVYI